MTAKATLLLDLDGTLTDNFAGISRSILHALAKLGACVVSEAELRHCVGPPLRQSFARLRQGHMLRLYQAIGVAARSCEQRFERSDRR